MRPISSTPTSSTPFRRSALYALAILLAALGLAVPWSPPAVAADPARIMIVGDSITQGSAGDYTWRYRLARQLSASAVDYDLVGPRNDLFDNVRDAHGAQTYADGNFDRDHNARWGAPAIQVKDTIGDDVRTATPDVVLVLLGINDLAWFDGPAGTESSLRSLVANARTARPGVDIVLGNVLPTQRAGEEPAFADKVTDLNNRIATIVSSMNTADERVVAADPATGFVAADDTWDGVHPNARGEVKIAAAFAKSLSSGLGIGTPFALPLPTPATGPPTAPTLTVTNGDGQADISWTESPGATGYWVWTRNVTDGEAWKRLPIPLGLVHSPWTAGLLSNGGVYEFKLQTTKGDDTGVFSNVATARPTGPTPGAASLSIANGDGEATLSWSKGSNATAVYVWTRNVTDGEAWKRLPIPLGGTSWTAGQLGNGGVYEFKLESVNGYQLGAYSNVATARPTGPAPGAASLSISSGDREATLSWSKGSNATAVYVWTRNVTDGEAWKRLPIPLGGTSWTAGQLGNGGVYEFKLESVNGYLLGGHSNVVTARPAGPNPGSASLSIASGDRKATLSWNPGSNATAVYVWTRNVTEGEAWHRLQYPLGGTSWTAEMLANGGVYEFKLQSVNGYQLGGYSNVVTARPSGPAAGPSSLSISSGFRSATLSWTKGSNTTAVYVWTRNVTEGEAWHRLQYPLGGTSWTAELLANGGRYEFKLQSVNGYQLGSYSNVATAWPSGPAPGAPSLSVSAADGGADLSWTRPSGTTQVYIWTRNVSAGEAWQRLPIPLSGTSWHAGQMVNGAYYEFKVQAYDGYVAGGTSEVRGVVPAGPNPPVPGGLWANDGNGEVTLHWNAAPHATGYYVYWKKAGAYDQFTPWAGTWERSQFPVAGTSWSVPYLANGQNYMFYVRAVNGLQHSTCEVWGGGSCTWPVWSAPEPPDLTINRKAQETSDWCCTAAAQSALGHFGQNPSQSSLAGQIGIGPDWWYLFGYPPYVADALDGRGAPYTAYSNVGGSSLHNVVLNSINFRKGPVIVVVRPARLPWRAGSGMSDSLAHCIVIYGYEVDGLTTKYHVWDPADNTIHDWESSEWDWAEYTPSIANSLGGWMVAPD